VRGPVTCRRLVGRGGDPPGAGPRDPGLVTVRVVCLLPDPSCCSKAGAEALRVGVDYDLFLGQHPPTPSWVYDVPQTGGVGDLATSPLSCTHSLSQPRPPGFVTVAGGRWGRGPSCRSSCRRRVGVGWWCRPHFESGPKKTGGLVRWSWLARLCRTQGSSGTPVGRGRRAGVARWVTASWR